MEKRCIKSAPCSEDPHRVLFLADSLFPVNFDLLESSTGAYLVAIIQGYTLHLAFFESAHLLPQRKLIHFVNDYDIEYKEVLLIVRFGLTEAGEMLCAAGETGFVYIINLVPLEQLDFWVLKHHLKTVMDIRFVAEERLVTASQDHSVILWDLRLRQVLCQWIASASRLSAANQALLLPQSTLFLAGYDDGVLRVLDPQKAEVVFFAEELVDANICAIEAVGTLLFIRSVTGRLSVVAVDLAEQIMTVLKFFNLDIVSFSYFDALTISNERFLLTGCGENHWTALELHGDVLVAHRFVCSNLSKVKRVMAAESSTLIVLCDDQKVIYDYVKL